MAGGRLMAHGSSPLTRGALPVDGDVCAGGRLIPAHAGSTSEFARQETEATAHPRSRGEHETRHGGANGVDGSSPLTRGAPLLCAFRCSRMGLIPAHAGSTSTLCFPV